MACTRNRQRKGPGGLPGSPGTARIPRKDIFCKHWLIGLSMSVNSPSAGKARVSYTEKLIGTTIKNHSDFLTHDKLCSGGTPGTIDNPLYCYGGLPSRSCLWIEDC